MRDPYVHRYWTELADFSGWTFDRAQACRNRTTMPVSASLLALSERTPDCPVCEALRSEAACREEEWMSRHGFIGFMDALEQLGTMVPGPALTAAARREVPASPRAPESG